MPVTFDQSAVKKRLAKMGNVALVADSGPVDDAITPEDMRVIVDQAVSLVSSYYVHLPLKRALYASDPEQQLRILGNRLRAEPLKAPEFHREMGAIFAGLRDLHTCYTLPDPYRRRIAFLPFLVEACTEDGKTRYLVTKTFGTFANSDFKRGDPDDARTHVEVTHWNGTPIARAVALNGERCGGSNTSARRARGLERLTFRWLGRMPVPDEDWVVVTYRVDGADRSLCFPWLVVERAESAGGRTGRPPDTRGLDREGEWIRDVKRRLFADSSGAKGAPEHPKNDALTDFFAYRTKTSKDGRKFGHLRIYSFNVERNRRRSFVAAIRTALRTRTDGLIIDIRGNPGGDVLAADQVLQAISPVAIQPEILEFINTPRSVEFAGRLYEGSSLFETNREEALTTGAQYLLSPPFGGGTYDVAQVYQGPVVLIVDALSYSAADVFAAGFEDHGLGKIIGTDPQTGGGGGNVWELEGIRRFDRSIPRPVEHRASFDIALRRTRRVGRSAGSVLEDRGVLAGRPVPLSASDVLGDNPGLIEAAIRRFGDDPEMQARHLRCRATRGGRRFRLFAEGLERVDLYVDGRPVASVTDPDGKTLEVPPWISEITSARLEGFLYAQTWPPAQPALTVQWPARAAGAA